MLDRRAVVGGVTLATLLGSDAQAGTAGDAPYASVGRIRAKSGRRSDLIAAIERGGEMPGNLSYYIAEDVADADAVWVFETWRDKAAHDASLALPAVRAAIAAARPLIAGFESGAELRIVSERISTDGF